ncbi:MAG TPA: Arm DNA-binding domain-containing protein, partial [Steroidobacteraceae bacterium]|nr:Arm DNA-binding domain-containing protein [Steroidobacteraceae bacterium]
MPQNTLTDREIRTAKPAAKPYRLADGDGLYLRVSTTGAKSWEYRYRHAGKQQTASLGKLDSTPLAEARKRAQGARELAGKGEHLTHAKNVAKAQRAAAVGDTFKAVAAAWVEDTARDKRWSLDHRSKVVASLGNHLGALDPLPVTSITALICDKHLRKVEQSAPD